MRQRRSLASWLVAASAAATLVACQVGAPPGNGGSGSARLSISSPVTGRVLSGTVAVAAAGVGGAPVGLTFRLGTVQATADGDGIAIIDTRGLPDGAYSLEATATVAGRAVSDQVEVEVRNALPASGMVGPDGGALRSTAGSFATLPPGAVSASAFVSVEDTTQEEILAAFGIDYPALGVTFLGSLTVDADVDRFDRPIEVDLAGWAEAVQPNQQVVMFTIGPDASGDGIGELMFAANAMAAPNGSVITRPTPRSEVYGPGGGAAASRLQAASARPGEIVTLEGRGFTTAGLLSNVARFAGGHDVLVIPRVVDDSAFNPLMELRLAVPALSPGEQEARLHNLVTGYATDPLTIQVLSPGAGSADTFDAFVEQVRAAVTSLTQDRDELASSALTWVATVDAVGGASATAASMVQASGLVSAENAAAMTGLTPGAITAAQRALLFDHALVLDALAFSVAGLEPAADVATLLVALGAGGPATAAAASGGASRAAAGRLQSGGDSCSGAPANTDISIGTPTGMGSAPPGSCFGGNASGSSGGGDGAAFGAERTSHRAGSFGPAAGAFVALFRQGTLERLSPFTVVTGPSGYVYLPFAPPNEPYTIRAVHPATGHTAEVHGTTGDVNALTPVQLVFSPSPGGTGEIAAEFTVTPLDLPGSYRFDNTPFNDPNQAITYEYVWDFGQGYGAEITVEPAVTESYLRSGTYDVSLSVVDTVTLASAHEAETVVVDLLYPLVAEPAIRISESPAGEEGTGPTSWQYDISADGRFVVFASAASNLVEGDTNGHVDIFVFDGLDGTIERVSVDEDGEEFPHGFSNPSVSDDGRYVAFQRGTSGSSTSSTLVKDRDTGALREIASPDALASTIDPVLSADGGLLAFASYSFSGGSNYSSVYVIDLETDEVTHVSEGFTVEDRARQPSLSADGRFVAFVAGGYVNSSVEGQHVFVHDLDLGVTVRASESAAGVPTVSANRPRLSADGRFVTFHAAGTGQPDDENGPFEMDIFVKDLDTGELELVSANALGQQATIDSYGPTISDDGRWVVFGSYAPNLVPVPRGSCDLCFGYDYVPGFSFVKDRETGWVALLSVGPGDAMPDAWDQTDPVISGDGRWVAFRSYATNMAPDASGDWQLYLVENPLWVP
jgi:hypothetical protein